MKTYYVYILASKKNGTLYIGLTNELDKRVLQHKRKQADSFTSKYSIDKLVYYEEFTDHNEAFLRERRLKKWNRAWKIRLIEGINPDWNDLASDWE